MHDVESCRRWRLAAHASGGSGVDHDADAPDQPFASRSSEHAIPAQEVRRGADEVVKIKSRLRLQIPQCSRFKSAGAEEGVGAVESCMPCNECCGQELFNRHLVLGRMDAYGPVGSVGRDVQWVNTLGRFHVKFLQGTGLAGGSHVPAGMLTRVRHKICALTHIGSRLSL
jgi:hypothetical protein